MKSICLLAVFRAISLRLFLALVVCTAFGSRVAQGYAMAIDMHPGGWNTSDYQGAWGWFFSFKEPNGGFHLMMTHEKPDGTSARDVRWVSGSGDEPAILCHRGISLPPFLDGSTTLVWHDGQIPVCRWVSPRDGEIFINYSLAATGDLPKGVPVRLTVSGKDVEMSDSSAPSKRPEGLAFHREVLRMLYWFGAKVHKGSVLDFSLDLPARDPLAADVVPLTIPPSHGAVTVRIGLQPVEFNAFAGLYRPIDEERRRLEILENIRMEAAAQEGGATQPEPQGTEEQLAREAQADAEPLRLLAHKTSRLLAGFPVDFSMQQGAGDWFYGSDDGSGFQPMKPEGAKWVGAEGITIAADKLTAVGSILPVIRWRCPVSGRMDMRCVFSNESISYGSIKIHRTKERAADLPPDAVGFGEIGGSGRVQAGVNDTGKGDLCEFRFALPKLKPTPENNASSDASGHVPGKEKAQEKQGFSETFETGACIQIIQQLEQTPPLPPRGPIMAL